MRVIKSFNQLFKEKRDAFRAKYSEKDIYIYDNKYDKEQLMTDIIEYRNKGYTFNEIAMAVGLNKNTIKSKYYKYLKNLTV